MYLHYKLFHTISISKSMQDAKLFILSKQTGKNVIKYIKKLQLLQFNCHLQ